MALVKEIKVKMRSQIENLSSSGAVDGEPELTECVAAGFMKTNGESYEISFTERDRETFVVTEITVMPSCVCVKKTGDIVSDMRFEEGIMHKSLYKVPPYLFDAEIYTKKIRNNLNKNGGDISVFYTMRLGGADKAVKLKIECSV